MTRPGVNVTVSGPVATPVRPNDGSERVTDLPRQTCQRRAPQPARAPTPGRLRPPPQGNVSQRGTQSRTWG